MICILFMEFHFKNLKNMRWKLMQNNIFTAKIIISFAKFYFFPAKNTLESVIPSLLQILLYQLLEAVIVVDVVLVTCQLNYSWRWMKLTYAQWTLNMIGPFVRFLIHLPSLIRGVFERAEKVQTSLNLFLSLFDPLIIPIQLQIHKQDVEHRDKLYLIDLNPGLHLPSDWWL